MTKNPVKPDERTAAGVGGNAGGAYLDKIGVYDLRKLNGDQWIDFCSAIFVETCAELKRRADDEIPF